MAKMVKVTTIRPDGSRKTFSFEALLEENCLHSTEAIPEPHEFTAELELLTLAGNSTPPQKYSVQFVEHHDLVKSDRDDDHHGHGHDHDETFHIQVTKLTTII